MKEFHISDILSATTGRLVSYRHMEGVYAIYNFLMGDDLYTHQLPRAFHACKPHLAAQFPKLMEEDAEMAADLAVLAEEVEKHGDGAGNIDLCAAFVLKIRTRLDLPEMLPVREMGDAAPTHVDPVEELVAMVGEERVIVIGEAE